MQTRPRLLLLLLMTAACSTSASGTATLPADDARSSDAPPASHPVGGMAGVGDVAGASGSGGVGSGSAGAGGHAAGSGGGGSTSIDAAPSSAPDSSRADASAPPDTAAPSPVPYLCSGMRAQDNGQLTTACRSPAIGIECRALNPGPTAEPCVLDGLHDFLYMCVLAGFSVPNDAFCCGTQYAGPGETQCHKEKDADQNCRCCYPSTPAAPMCTTDAECCSGKCSGGHCQQ